MKRVYFIKPIDMDGPIKIGCSVSPDGRRSTLTTWSPFPLEVVAEIEGCLELERRFHARFFAHWTHREWFKAAPELLDTIAAIQSGSFDIETLPPPKRLPGNSGPPKGFKWSEERKAEARRWRTLRRIEKETGLVTPWPWDADVEAKFMADPHRYGITQKQRMELITAEGRSYA